MKRYILLTIFVLTIFFHATKTVAAAELVVNGGFETGNFTGWTVGNGTGAYINWSVGSTNHGGGFTPVPVAVTPVQGNFSAWQGVAGSAGSTFSLSQDVTLPAGSTISLSWAERFQSNLTSFCGGSGQNACGTHTYRVQILNTSNVVLQNLQTIVAQPRTNTNTGWRTIVVSLNAYAGTTIRLRFSTVASANLDGPGQLDIDAVSIQSPAIVTASNVSIGGRVTTANGQGIRSAEVFLTDQNGNSRTATTGAFGAYNFSGVPAGATYIVTVSAKRYQFNNPSQVLTLNENATGIDFIAIE